MRTAYLDTLYQLAEQDSNVFALISDNGAIVYDKFRTDFGRQYVNLGISEANMLGVAAGMASCGKIPFAYTIGAFLAYRALEFIRNDICLQNQNVKIIGTGAGMVYSALGPTHHTTEDMGALRSLPNLTIFTPATPLEVRYVTKAAYEIKGPVYIRLGTNKETEIYQDDYNFQIGKGVVIKEGTDITVVSTGSIVVDVLKAAKELEQQQISVRILTIHTMKPFDKELIIQALKETKGIVTVEDHNIIGGLGSAVSEVIAESGLATHFKRVGLVEHFSKGYGSYSEVKEANHIGVKDILSAVVSVYEESYFKKKE